MKRTVRQFVGGGLAAGLLAAAGVAGLAMPAAATETETRATQGDRVTMSTFGWQSSPVSFIQAGLPSNHPTGLAYVVGNSATEQSIRNRAEVWELPAPGTTGVVKNSAGQCLDVMPHATSTALTFADCNGDTEQQWFLREDGYIYHGPSMSSTMDRVRISATTVKWLYLQPSNGSETAFGFRFAMDDMSPVAPEAAELTAVVDSVDNDERSAALSGTGEPGATITVTSPTGDVTTTIGTDGTWTINVPGLAVGENTLPVTQTIDGKESEPVNVVVTIQELEIPIASPFAAAALVVGLGGAAAFASVRRRAQKTA